MISSIKIQKDQVYQVSGLVNLRFKKSGLIWEGLETPYPFPMLCSMYLFHLAIPEL